MQMCVADFCCEVLKQLLSRFQKNIWFMKNNFQCEQYCHNNFVLISDYEDIDIYDVDDD